MFWLTWFWRRNHGWLLFRHLVTKICFVATKTTVKCPNIAFKRSSGFIITKGKTTFWVVSCFAAVSCQATTTRLRLTWMRNDTYWRNVSTLSESVVCTNVKRKHVILVTGWEKPGLQCDVKRTLPHVRLVGESFYLLSHSRPRQPDEAMWTKQPLQPASACLTLFFKHL